MPVFWETRHAVMTDEWLVTIHGCIPIRDIVRLWVTCGSRSRSAITAFTMGSFLMIAAVISARTLPGWYVVIVAALAVSALLLAALINWLHPPIRGLWVMLDGHPVCLFSSSDAVEFGKFVRSLRRAMTCSLGSYMSLPQRHHIAISRPYNH